MSAMSELSAQQDILDKINPSEEKRFEHDIFHAVLRLCNASTQALVKNGITSSTIKSIKDMLEWKQMDLYAEEQKEAPVKQKPA